MLGRRLHCRITMALIEIPVATSNGHSSRLRLHRAEGGRDGLLWFPALGVPAGKYDALASSLASHGISCAVHEWRGQGSSSLRAGRGVDWGYRELLQQDVPAAITALDAGVRWHFGGHSLGGQFAAMAAAAKPQTCAGLVLVATGVPHAAAFSGRQRLGIGLFAGVIPLLTALAGYYPGHRLGFAGREAGQLMRDWAATIRSGRYLGYGNEETMDTALARLHLPALGIRMSRDRLVPQASLDALLAKLGGGRHELEVFDAERLGTDADHFRWMRRPEALATRIADWVRANP
jgi:predicted alpha/beta hydrolase